MIGEASRLSIVSDGTNSATYGYLANSPLVETITFKENSTERMETEKVYDYLNRLTSITHSTNSVAVAEYVYEYNDANQRVRVDEVDDSYWIYEYDSLGQVKSGKKYWSDGTPVAGQQFVYSFDDIGNRKHAASGGNEWGAGLRYANYNVNSLNQYTSRTVPAAVDVIGMANANSTVTVNNQPPYRKGEYFWGELSIGNQSAPVYQGITNLAVLKDAPNADIVTNSTGHVLLPATPETFLHDLDGNLVRDGLWTNTWNGENRLVRTESLSSVPESARARVDWTYLPDGRWIERIVSTWVSGTYVPQSTNRFVWDGQVLLGILDEENAATLSFMRGLDLSGTMQGAGGVGGLLTVTDHSASEAHFVGNDGNGNVGLLVAAVDGIESARYAYSPFGETLRATGDVAAKNPMRFSGQYADDSTRGAKYLFREYRPGTGRWLNRDPISELSWWTTQEKSKSGKLAQLLHSHVTKSSPHDTAFLGNNSIDRTDYLGLQSQCAHDKDPQECSSNCKYNGTLGKCVKQKPLSEFNPWDTNGCGAQDGVDVPDDPMSVVPPFISCAFSSPCDVHDACYGICNSNKQKCDFDFYEALLGNCYDCYEKNFSGWDPRGWIWLGDCSAFALAYYSAVAGLGGSAYTRGQQVACEECCCK